MEHYFINSKQASETTEFVDYIGGQKYQFISAEGVFSKDKIDYGSKTLIEYLLEQNLSGKLLDIGCGVGVISIALAQRFNSFKGELIDVNQNAVKLAELNIAKFNLADRLNATVFDVREYQNSSFECEFDVAVCNPPIRAGKNIVFNCYDLAEKALKSNGVCYIVIQKKQGANSSKKYLEEIFAEVKVVKKNAGYYIIRAIKDSSL